MIEIESKALKAALRAIAAVIEKRTTVPILANVLMVASKKGLALTGTDLDIQIERRVDGDGRKPFTTTASAAILSSIVGKMPAEGIIKLELDDGKLKVSSGTAKFSMATLPPDDLPLLPALADAVQFSLPAPQIATIIDTVGFAISTEETRYYLNGIFLHVSGDERRSLKAAATDGHRLATISLPLPDGAEEMPDVIVPRKCLTALRQLVDKSDQAVEIAVTPTRIRFVIGSDVLTAKLIDGTFPDYSRVIPTANDKLLRIDPRALAESVDRVVTIASEKTRAVKWELGPDKLSLTVVSAENGTGADEVSGDYADTGFEIGFNSRYLLDLLKRLPGDSIEIELADSAAPTLFRASKSADALFVLMPMRV